MKKLFVILSALLTVASVASAANTKIGFQPYSSATKVTCTVYGSPLMARDYNGQVIQAHPLDSGWSRSYSLGTKSMANYSTNYVKSVKFTCTTTGSNTAQAVKVYLNGITSYFLTLAEGWFGIVP